MRPKRIVVKIGSSLLTQDGGELDSTRMERFVADLTSLHAAGAEVVLVTSGAIAAGVGELGWDGKPTDLPRKQAAAAD